MKNVLKLMLLILLPLMVNAALPIDGAGDFSSTVESILASTSVSAPNPVSEEILREQARLEQNIARFNKNTDLLRSARQEREIYPAVVVCSLLKKHGYPCKTEGLCQRHT